MRNTSLRCKFPFSFYFVFFFVVLFLFYSVYPIHMSIVIHKSTFHGNFQSRENIVHNECYPYFMSTQDSLFVASSFSFTRKFTLYFDLRQRSEWVKLFWQACLRHHIFATLVKFNLNLGNLKSQLQTETLYFLCLHILVYKMNLDLSKSSSQLAEFRNVPSRTIIRCEEGKPSNYSLFSFLHCYSSWT